MSDQLNPPDLGASLIATPEGRRLLSVASPTFFDTYYCGMIACQHRTAWLDRIESARNEAKETGHTKALLFLAPRDHGKTEAGISVVTRAICTNRNVRVLWVAVSGDPARKRVRRIKQLLTSEKVENDWLQGRPWRRNKMLDEWDKSKIYIDRDIQSVDPTLEAVGAGGSVTGGHFDLIVCHELGTPMLHDDAWIPVEEHPSFRGARECEGVEVGIYGVPFKEVVTPEHRYWARARNHQTKDKTKRGHHHTSPGWVEAKDLTEFHMLGYPIDYTVTDEFPALEVYRPGSPGDGVRKGGGGFVEEVPREFYDPEWWWALGLWWGDGHLTGKDYGLAWSCPTNRPENVERLKALMGEYGKKLTRVDRPGAMDGYQTGHAQLARWLRTWYVNGNKIPPAWVERMDYVYQAAFLRGYMDSDGYYTEKDIRLTSVNLDGLLMVRRMLARLGIPSTIRLGPAGGPTVICGVPAVSKQRYDLRFDQGREALGYDKAPKRRRARDFIEDGFLWSKVRSLTPTGVQKFAPIKTEDSEYITHFGLSHNCDDLEDDRTVYSSTERRKTRDWFRGTLMPMLANGGTIVAIGTRKHNDDLYYHLLEDPTFEVIRDPACFTIDEDGNKQPYIPPHTPVYENREGKDILVSCDVSDEADEFHTLWPEYKGIQYLLKTLHSAERRMFQREYQHVVVDDQTAVFKWDEHLIPALDRGNLMSLYECPQGVQPFDLRVVQGWDLSLVTSAETAQAKDRDYTVGITWAEGPGGMRYLLGLIRERGVSMGRVQELIQGEYDRFDEMGMTPKMVLIEKNSFGELHLANLLENTTLPVQGHFTSAAKKSDPWEGVPSLVALFEKHRVVLPSRGKYTKDRVGVLCDELVNLEASRHDDTVMALWIAETAHRPKYRGGDPVKPKRSVVRKVAKEEELDMSRYVLTNKGWKDGKAPPGLRRRKRRFG